MKNKYLFHFLMSGLFVAMIAATSFALYSNKGVFAEEVRVDGTLPQVSRMVVTGSLSNPGTTIVFTFSESMNPSSVSWAEDAENPGTFDAGSILYAYDSSDYTSSSFGTGATAVFSTDAADNDVLTVTLGTSPTLADGDTVSFSFPDVNWEWVSPLPRLDTAGPSLTGAYLTGDVGNDGAATQTGDTFVLLFNEPIDTSTVTGNISFSGGAFANVPTITVNSDNILFALTGAETNFVGRTVTLGAGLKDMNGNSPTNPNPLPTVQAIDVAPATNVVLSDPDTTGWGIDATDIRVSWTAPAEGDHINIYLLPDRNDTPLNLAEHSKLNSSPITLATTTFNGSDSTLSISGDSRSDFVDYYPYFYFNAEEQYVAYVVSCDATETVCLPVASDPFLFTNDMSSGSFTNFGWQSTYVMNTTPWSYSSIPVSQRTFSMQFSGPMDESTLDTDTVTLTVEGGAAITGTVGYDASFNTVHFKVTGNTPLASNSTLLFSVTGAEDANGGTVTAYTTNFYTTAESDSTAPAVSWSTPADNDAAADTLMPVITVGFGEGLDPTTITSSSWYSEPAITADTQYDAGGYSINLQMNNGSLLPDTDYAVTFDGAVIKDASGNALGTNYVLNFHTGAAVTDAPTVTFVTFRPDGFELGFDLPMKTAALQDSENYSLTCANAPVSLSTANFYWDTFTKVLSVTGVPLTEGNSCTVTLSQDIQATNNMSLAEASLIQTGAVAQVTSGTDYYTDFAASDDGAWYHASGDLANYYNPTTVWSDVRIAGLSSNFHFNFPITQPLSTGDTIDITFPVGFDISAATLNDDWGSLFWDNRDINSWADQTVALSAISDNQATRTVSVTLSIDGDGTIGESGDQLSLTLGNITNSDVPSTDYVLNFTTKSAEGQTIEGPTDFDPIEVSEAGAGSVTVQVVDAVTEDPIAIEGGISVVFNNWAIGNVTVQTNGQGEATVTGIPIDDWGTQVYAWIDGSRPINGYLPNWSGANFSLTTEVTTQTQTIALTPANLRISGTITHTGIGTDGVTKVNLWASGPSWTNTAVTLDADGSTNYTLQLGDAGWYTVGVDKYWDPNAGYDTKAAFVTPPPQQIVLAEDNTSGNPADQDFTLTSADKSIVITVTDQSGAPVTNGWCSVSADQSSGVWFWTGGQTDTAGVCDIAVAVGSYNVEVNMPGVYSRNSQTVKVEAADSSVPLSFVLSTPDNTLSGNVNDGNGNGVQWASVSCWSTDGGWGWNMTDASGDFTFLLNNGTWSCNALAPNLGEVPAATGVDATNFAVTGNVTGLNFAYDPDAFATITGTVQKADTTAVAYSWLSVEKYDSETKQFVGWGNGASTDTDGAFSVQVVRNTGTERYRIMMWDGALGNFLLQSNIDVSAGSQALGTLTLPALYDVTMSATAVPGDMSNLWVNIMNEDSFGWNGAEIVLTDGSGSGTIGLSAGSYSAHLWLPGLGEYTQTFEVSGAGSSVDFDFSDVSTSTITVTVVDDNGNPVSNAYVSVVDTANDTFVDGFTDAEGVASVTVLESSDSNFVVMANEPDHISDQDTLTASENSTTLILRSADETISGNVTDDNGNPVSGALVEGQSSDGTAWTSTYTDGDGNYTLPVAAGDYNITVRDDTGAYGTEASVSAGNAAADVVTDQTTDYFVNADPEVSNLDPTSEVSLSTALASITADANALSEDSNGISLAIDDTAAAPEINNTGAPGSIAVSIGATDSDGNTITNLNDDVTLEVNYTDEQIEAMITAGETSMAALDVCLGYYDTINGAWVCLSGSQASITYQENAGEDYVTEDLTTWLAANPTSPQTVLAGYEDATIDYTAQTDHFTLFAPVINNSNNNSNSTPSGSSRSRTSEAAAAPAADAGTGAATETGAGAATGGDAASAAPAQGDQAPAEPAGETAHGAAAPAVLAPFADVQKHWSKEFVDKLYSLGVIKGKTDKAFAPDDSITRAEMLKIALEAFDYKIPTRVTKPFSDVASNSWYAPYVQVAKSKKIIGGYADGSFHPNQPVTRVEALKILAAAAKLKVDSKGTASFKDTPKDSWYMKYVAFAKANDIVAGYPDGTFRPEAKITRGEIAKITVKIMDMKQ